MGKATITAGGADGSYTITMDYGKAARDAAIVRIIARQGELATPLAEIQALVDAKQVIEDAARQAAEAAIDTYVAATRAVPVAAQAVANARAALDALLASTTAGPHQTDEERAAIAAATAAHTAAIAAHTAAKAAIKTTLDAYTQAAAALITAKRATAEVNLTLEFVKAERAQLEKDLTYWQNVPVEETLQAWCADLTEDATGAVATLEIPGESALVIIEPKAPAHVPATHGVLTAREVQTDAQVFVNAAILPGWQKYKPTYRRGTITAINQSADTADVLLEVTDKSSAQKLIINQTPTLAAVPVQYMTCNAGAFEVGDRCVVKFTAQDWAQPKIVGFVDNPKSCGVNLACAPSSVLHKLGYTPPGLAGPSAYWPGALKSPLPAALKPSGDLHSHPGVTTWSNPSIIVKGDPVVLSWRGPDHRYEPTTDWDWEAPDTWERGHQQYFTSTISKDSGYVWINGYRIDTPCAKVIAAALFQPEKVTNPARVVLRVCSDAYPVGGFVKKLVFFDLELAGPAPQMTLAALFHSPALVITATRFGPPVSDTGFHFLIQRPHFNRAATQIAASCGYQGKFVAATIDVMSGAFVPFFTPIKVITLEKFRNDTGTYGPSTWYELEGGLTIYGGPIISFTIESTQTSTTVQQTLHAVDFVGDDPVAVYTEVTHGNTVTFTGTYASDADAFSASWPTDATRSLSSASRSAKFIHTLHGVLLEKTYSDTIDASFGTLNEYNGLLLGDLSKNIFSLGLAKTDFNASISSLDPSIDRVRTTYNPQYEFCFLYKDPDAPGLKKATATRDGGYQWAQQIEPWPQPSYTGPPGVTSSWVPPYSDGSVTVPAGDNGFETFTSYQTAYAPSAYHYQHSAADPLGHMAYFGCGQYHGGFDAVLKVVGEQLLTMPAYAPGGFPNTLMAPVILSRARLAAPPAPPP